MEFCASRKRTHRRSRTSSNSSSSSNGKTNNNVKSTICKLKYCSSSSDVSRISFSAQLPVTEVTIAAATTTNSATAAKTINSHIQSPVAKILKRSVGSDFNKQALSAPTAIADTYAQNQQQHTAVTTTMHSSSSSSSSSTTYTPIASSSYVSISLPSYGPPPLLSSTSSTLDRVGVIESSASYTSLNNNVSNWDTRSALLKYPISYTYSNHNAPIQRKRRASDCFDKDPELGFEMPSAKRQQRLPSFYQSDADSVVSSVYASPADELVNEIDTHSSQSECSSSESEYDITNDDIPDSPNSLHEATIINATDGEEENDGDDDEEIVSSTSSPSVSSVASSTISAETARKSAHELHSSATLQQVDCHVVHAHHHHGERTPAQHYLDNDSVLEEQNNRRVKSFDAYVSEYNCMTPATESEPPRQCPLPALSWANAYDVWQVMCKNDEEAACLRDANMLKQHPSLQPRMRAILLDWLIEVCEVYKLHRETYYLAMDYLDRYLSSQKRVQKTHLQLIGITCLFIAAKVEEIYPPKIGEFAYVTDGACQESDILQHEILLLQALDWNISPVTPIGWLGVYMQLKCNNRTPKSFNTGNKITGTKPTLIDDAFIFPQFSGMEFVQSAQLLDLCSLDVGFANYSYSVLAAAAISHMYSNETAVGCSGLEWQIIAPCARWMEPFFDVISKESPYLHLLEQNEPYRTNCGFGIIYPKIVTDDSHIIQTHTTNMTMFDRACMLQEQDRVLLKIKQEASPATGLTCPEGLLTPPASSRKPLGVVDDNIAVHCSSSSNTSSSDSSAKNL